MVAAPTTSATPEKPRIKMKLYEQSEHWSKIQESLIESEGEITPEIQELMNQVPWVDIQDKVDSICKIIRMEESFKKQCDEEIARLQAIARTRSRTVDGLKRYLLVNLQTLNRKDVDTGTFKVWRQNSPPALNIYDESKLDPKYFTGSLNLNHEEFGLIPESLQEKIIKKPNTQVIKDEIKRMVPIDGAELTQSEHVRMK